MFSDPHAGFIIAAYAISAVTVVALVAWIWADYGVQRRLLHELEARGVRRRSEKAHGGHK